MIPKLIIFNFAAFCAVTAATFAGLVLPTFEADLSYVSYVIVATLIYGTVLNFKTAFQIDKATKAGFAHIADLNGYLVMLGLIGTAIGVLIALGGAASGASADDVKAFTQTVLSGTKVAFHSTIVGSIAYLWHHINCRIVYSGITEQ